MRHDIELKDGDIVYISRNGNCYAIEVDPQWCINIEPLGCSLVPKCTALAERPDLCKKQAPNG